MVAKKDNHNLSIAFSIIVIGLVSAICYLPLINQFGFMRDDWYLIWTGYTQGANKIIDLFSTDRPALGYLYSWTYSFLGSQPLHWNIFSYVIRLLSFLGVYWILTLIWPRQNYKNTLVTLLVVVYPGFLQQPNGNTFSNLFIAHTLSILSIGLTLQAVIQKNKLLKVVLIAISTIISFLYLLIAEYLIGMEVIRLILVWYSINKIDEDNPIKSKLITFFSLVLPNLVIAILVLIWRLFIFQSDRPAMNVGNLVDSYTLSPGYNILRLAVEFLKDQFELVVGAWAVPFYNLARTTRLKEFLVSMLFFAIVVTIFLIYRRINIKHGLNNNIEKDADKHTARDYLVLGLLCMIFTSIPVILSNRHVHFQTNWDRYSLQSSLGVALVIMGLLSYIQKEWLRVFLYACLLGIAVSTHYFNAVNFKERWELHKELLWQLYWRAPEILADTVLSGDLYHYSYEEDYELWGPINLIYYPTSQEVEIKVEVLNDQTIKNIVSSFWDQGATRIINYERDYENVLVFTIPSEFSCLHIIDGDNPVLSEFTSPEVMTAAPFSKINRIKPEQSIPFPPEDIFGTEPDQNWCFYFQKASLASQNGNFDEVVRIAKEIEQKGLKPNDWSEWVPFIEGYAYTGNFSEAKKLIPIIREMPFVKYQVCKKLEMNVSNLPDETVYFLMKNFRCPKQ